jgi:CubicO group peptidase (beta-lactamase class C family)
MKKSIAIVTVLILGFNALGQTKPTKELSKNIHQIFESYAHYNRFIGSVLISKNDQVIYRKSFGYANIDRHKKNTKNSIFSIASVTKPLTAVGIMKLVEEGKLTLETPIKKYFPNFIPEYSKKITIRHLLNHSSGMQANIGRIDDAGNGFMPGKNNITLEQLLEKFKDTKLNFEPGKGYEYNNFGYTLLAYIIEKVSKKTYANYMEQAVFKPANMKKTSVEDFKSINKRALPHTGLGMNKFIILNNEINFSGVKGAGDINSTTGDLYNFMSALETGVLLKPETVTKLYNDTQDMGYNNSKYGLGWRIEHKEGEKWINHTGLLPGYTSIIGSLPKRDIKIIILTNATSTDLNPESEFNGKNEFVSSEIIDTIIAVLQGKKSELLPIPIKDTKKNRTDFSKTYKMDTTHSLVITKQGENYSLNTIGTNPWSVFTYPFSRDAKEDDKISETGLLFAKAMSTQNFEGLSDHANNDMKDLFVSKKGIGMLKGVWQRATKNGGKFLSYNIYKIEGKEGAKIVRIRFHFEKNDFGLLIGINSKNKIQGLFSDNNVKTSHILKVKLIRINENEFFINGHQNSGMQDLKIKINKDGLILIDGNLHFEGVLTSTSK